jgi:hypothetical protein
MRLRLPIALLFLSLACGVGAGSAAAIEMPTYGRAFCKGTTLHDYQQPLDALPAVDHPPEQLPFGPRNLNLYQSAWSRVIVGKGGFGYGFFDETYRERTLHLNWDVSARVSRIDSSGLPLATIAERTLRLGDVTEPDEIDHWLKVPAGPALYRYDLEFHDSRTGVALGTYSEYMRVVRRSFHAGIAVNRKSFRPGQDAFARVENRGSEAVEFGVAYEVQRFAAGHWGRDLLGNRGWPAVLIGMGGGFAASCMRYRIPRDAKPGRYRFVKSLGAADGKHGGTRTAVFRVLG